VNLRLDHYENYFIIHILFVFLKNKKFTYFYNFKKHILLLKKKEIRKLFFHIHWSRDHLAYSLMKIVAKYVNTYDMQLFVIHYNIERNLQYIFKDVLVMKER